MPSRLSEAEETTTNERGKMFVPNLYTLKDRGKQYGLHKFQDGVVMLAIQHECGDWITLSPPTEAEVKYFEQYGEKVEKPRRSIELSA
jgi:hypothetical protein